MEIIKNQLLELLELCAKYPKRIPAYVVAKFLDMNEDGLRAALMRKNAPFGFGYQKDDGGNRVFIIPTVPFFLWYTQTTPQMVLGKAIG